MTPETRAMARSAASLAALAAAAISGVRVLIGAVDWILWPWELLAEFAVFFAAVLAWRWLRSRLRRPTL